MVAQQKNFIQWDMHWDSRKHIQREVPIRAIEQYSKLRLLPPNQQPTDPPTQQPYSVVNLHGIVGIGKSHILHNAYDHFRTTHTVIWWSFDTVDQNQHPDHKVSWTEATHILCKHPNYAYLPEQIAIPPQNGTSKEVPLSMLCHMHQHQDPNAPHLLLLDGLDDLDASVWRWLQGNLIKPLIDRQDTLIVCVSQSPILWYFWEIRDRGTLMQAEPFSLEETRQFLRLYDRELLAYPLYSLTLGYPIALNTALSMLEKPDQYGQSPSLTLDQHHPDLSPETYHLIITIGGGIIRRVEKRLLRQILQECSPQTPSPQIEQQITTALFELKAHRYLESYHKGQPLRFARAFRYAVEHWQQTNQQHSYLSLCTRLAETYYQRFSQQPITHLNALNEWLYFTASIALIHPEDSYIETWQQRLPKVLAHAHRTGERLRPYWFDEVVVVLYKDGELLEHLRRSNLFELVQRTIYELVGDHEHRIDLPIFNDSETITYCIQVLDLLIERLPEDRRNDMDAFHPGGLMKNIAELESHLNTVSLRESINTIRHVLEQDPLRPGYISRAVAFLNSRGFFPETDKHQANKYQLHKLIRKLALLPQELAQ
jgi:hypothetical protein